MIEGLMVTMTGEELQKQIGESAEAHRRNAARWKKELTRASSPRGHSLWPEQVCEHEAERSAWRADVLEYLRDHVDPSEVYRLGQRDLAFGELLPRRPGWLDQEEYERESDAGGDSPRAE